MSFWTEKATLKATGSTGTGTSAAYNAPDDANIDVFVFVIEAVGATPTITYQFEGSLDGTNWFPLMVDPSNADTGIASDTKTATGYFVYTLRLHRGAKMYRVNVTANTNVTYRSEIFFNDTE